MAEAALRAAARAARAPAPLLLALVVLASTPVLPVQAAKETYTAAVVEYSPALGVTAENAVERFRENIAALAAYARDAKAKGAEIVVFPECGLATLELPRVPPLGEPAVAVPLLPVGANPCVDAGAGEELRLLSCAARDAGVYVVANLPEAAVCAEVAPCEHCGHRRRDADACSPSGRAFYNTDVAFARNGTLVARYRKYNLYGEAGFTSPVKADMAVFDTDFGERFGLFTCFDIMFETPAVDLVRRLNVSNLIFPTAWFSELPFLTAAQTQAAWARALDVNLLAAGYNLPAVGSTGSGLFAGRRGAVAVVMEQSRVSRLVVGELPRRALPPKMAKAASGQGAVGDDLRMLVEEPLALRMLHKVPAGRRRSWEGASIFQADGYDVAGGTWRLGAADGGGGVRRLGDGEDDAWGEGNGNGDGGGDGNGDGGGKGNGNGDGDVGGEGNGNGNGGGEGNGDGEGKGNGNGDGVGEGKGNGNGVGGVEGKDNGNGNGGSGGDGNGDGGGEGNGNGDCSGDGIGNGDGGGEAKGEGNGNGDGGGKDNGNGGGGGAPRTWQCACSGGATDSSTPPDDLKCACVAEGSDDEAESRAEGGDEEQRQMWCRCEKSEGAAGCDGCVKDTWRCECAEKRGEGGVSVLVGEPRAAEEPGAEARVADDDHSTEGEVAMIEGLVKEVSKIVVKGVSDEFRGEILEALEDVLEGVKRVGCVSETVMELLEKREIKVSETQDDDQEGAGEPPGSAFAEETALDQSIWHAKDTDVMDKVETEDIDRGDTAQTEDTFDPEKAIVEDSSDVKKVEGEDIDGSVKADVVDKDSERKETTDDQDSDDQIDEKGEVVVEHLLKEISKGVVKGMTDEFRSEIIDALQVVLGDAQRVGIISETVMELLEKREMKVGDSEEEKEEDEEGEEKEVGLADEEEDKHPEEILFPGPPGEEDESGQGNVFRKHPEQDLLDQTIELAKEQAGSDREGEGENEEEKAKKEVEVKEEDKAEKVDEEKEKSEEKGSEKEEEKVKKEEEKKAKREEKEREKEEKKMKKEEEEKTRREEKERVKEEKKRKKEEEEKARRGEKERVEEEKRMKKEEKEKAKKVEKEKKEEKDRAKKEEKGEKVEGAKLCKKSPCRGICEKKKGTEVDGTQTDEEAEVKEVLEGVLDIVEKEVSCEEEEKKVEEVGDAEKGEKEVEEVLDNLLDDVDKEVKRKEEEDGEKKAEEVGDAEKGEKEVKEVLDNLLDDVDKEVKRKEEQDGEKKAEEVGDAEKGEKEVKEVLDKVLDDVDKEVERKEEKKGEKKSEEVEDAGKGEKKVKEVMEKVLDDVDKEVKVKEEGGEGDKKAEMEKVLEKVLDNVEKEVEGKEGEGRDLVFPVGREQAGERDDEEEGLYLKTEDLSLYTTVPLPADETRDNSSMVVCHGAGFCCTFRLVTSVRAAAPPPKEPSAAKKAPRAAKKVRFDESARDAAEADADAPRHRVKKRWRLEKHPRGRRDDLIERAEKTQGKSAADTLMVTISHQAKDLAKGGSHEDDEDMQQQMEPDFEMKANATDLLWRAERGEGANVAELMLQDVQTKAAELVQLVLGEDEDDDSEQDWVEDVEDVEMMPSATHEGPAGVGGDDEDFEPDEFEEEEEEEEDEEEEEEEEEEEDETGKESESPGGKKCVGKCGMTVEGKESAEVEETPEGEEKSAKEPAEEGKEVEKKPLEEGKEVEKKALEEGKEVEKKALEEGKEVEKKSPEEDEEEEEKPPKVQAAPRYHYRIVVFNGDRTFDGLAEGGIQACGVIPCLDESWESCGKLHAAGAADAERTLFESVSISGRFRSAHALPMPSTLGTDLLPLPAGDFSFEVEGQGEGEQLVTMTAERPLSFLTFGVYSRVFAGDRHLFGYHQAPDLEEETEHDHFRGR